MHRAHLATASPHGRRGRFLRLGLARHGRRIGATAVCAVLLGAAGCGAPGSGDPGGARDESAADRMGCLAPSEPFDRDEARERARALLGLPESQVPESGTVRIARRGDERRALTMELRPGRCNVELDDDGANRFRVTRVSVEVPPGEEALVVD